MKCAYCGAETTLRCTLCGQPVCEKDICVVEQGSVRMATCAHCKQSREESQKKETEPEDIVIPLKSGYGPTRYIHI